MSKPVLHTIGHSTRPIDDFLELLHAHGVENVVDVRTIPRSRHNPQYDQMALRKALRAARIGYQHMPRLGGLRHARKGSPNAGWINLSFRGFADHMQSKDFQDGLRCLEVEARTRVTVIMCRGVRRAVSSFADRRRAGRRWLERAAHSEPKGRAPSSAYALLEGQ
jgi:uncharacterized protein (DUF488 family)